MFELTHSNGLHIPHLSASTINKFITDRFGFYQSKILREPFKGSVYTARGKAVEHAINEWIENDATELIDIALAKFDEEIREIGISKIEAEETRDAIPGLVNTAFAFYKPEFENLPAKTQHKISVQLDGVERDIIGYLDFFQVGKRVRDCKVVSRSPSKLSQDYILQGALYRKATGCEVVFDFFVDNKKPVHKPITLSDDDYIFGISYMTRAAQVLEELETCESPKRIIELMSFPNLDNLWTHQDKVVAAKQWGIQL